MRRSSEKVWMCVWKGSELKGQQGNSGGTANRDSQWRVNEWLMSMSAAREEGVLTGAVDERQCNRGFGLLLRTYTHSAANMSRSRRGRAEDTAAPRKHCTAPALHSARE